MKVSGTCQVIWVWRERRRLEVYRVRGPCLLSLDLGLVACPVTCFSDEFKKICDCAHFPPFIFYVLWVEIMFSSFLHHQQCPEVLLIWGCFCRTSKFPFVPKKKAERKDIWFTLYHHLWPMIQNSLRFWVEVSQKSIQGKNI